MLAAKDILNCIITSYDNILKNNLVGIYVHGSLAMNCYNPKTSDIDFLVVIKEKIDFNTKRELINILLKLSENSPQKGLEMSILLQEDTKHFKYPTPFILHFSKVYKEKYETDCNYMCEDGEDPDLAAHITVTNARGLCIFGKPIDEVFEFVPSKYYLQSILNDIKNSKEEIIDLPIYFILNLCRVLCYLKEGKVSSKKEGGQWACSTIPTKYVELVKQALLSYENLNIINYKPEILINFADFMLKEIYLNTP